MAIRLDTAWQNVEASEFVGDRARSRWHYHEYLVLAEGVRDRREPEAPGTNGRLRAFVE